MRAKLFKVSLTIAIALLAAGIVVNVGAPRLLAGVAPPNDDFDNAVVVSPLPFSDSQDTAGATTAGDDPIISCGAMGGPAVHSNSVWYRFTPGADTVINLSTEGSGYDTIMAVFTGVRGSLTEVACDDDTGAGLSSVISDLSTTGGTAYHIEVADFGAPGGGALTLDISAKGAPTPTPTATLNPTATATLEATPTATVEEPDAATATPTGAPPEPTATVSADIIAPDTGTGGSAGGDSPAWLIAALASVGLAGAAGYTALRLRARRS